MKRLENKVAIVTGGGGGIGTGVARRFVEEGALVVVADVSEEAAARTAASLGERALAVQFDAAAPKSVKAMVDKTVAHFGKLDILHNNAAMTDPVKARRIRPQSISRSRYGARSSTSISLATCSDANTRFRTWWLVAAARSSIPPRIQARQEIWPVSPTVHPKPVSLG